MACRTTAAPAGWARLALGPDRVLRAGRTAPGRGAWLCGEACFDAALQRGALMRALRRPSTIGPSTTEIEALRARLFG